MKTITRIRTAVRISVFSLCLAIPGSTFAAEAEINAANLAELLKMVQEGRVVNRQEIERREREATAGRGGQKRSAGNTIREK
jgi:hypothetical protein